VHVALRAAFGQVRTVPPHEKNPTQFRAKWDRSTFASETEPLPACGLSIAATHPGALQDRMRQPENSWRVIRRSTPCPRPRLSESSISGRICCPIEAHWRIAVDVPSTLKAVADLWFHVGLVELPRARLAANDMSSYASTPANRGPSEKTSAAVRPADYLPVPSASLVAVGNRRIGPTPQIDSFASWA
jgi:hypothetical protein